MMGSSVNRKRRNIQKSKNLKWILGTFLILAFSSTSSFAQQSITDLAGNWIDGSSWVGGSSPGYGCTGNISIRGEITSNSGINFDGGTLSITDNRTLIVYGNIVIGNNGELSIGVNSQLIIYGSLTVKNKVDIGTSGFLVVRDNLTIQGGGKGSFTSTNNPPLVYVGGAVDGPAHDNDYPVLDCGTTAHEGTGCNYGNLTDLEKEHPGILGPGKPEKPASPTGDTEICENSPNNDYVTTGATDATSYNWTITPAEAGTISGGEKTATVNWDDLWYGTATITVTGINDQGEGPNSDPITVTITKNPKSGPIYRKPNN